MSDSSRVRRAMRLVDDYALAREAAAVYERAGQVEAADDCYEDVNAARRKLWALLREMDKEEG